MRRRESYASCYATSAFTLRLSLIDDFMPIDLSSGATMARRQLHAQARIAAGFMLRPHYFSL